MEFYQVEGQKPKFKVTLDEGSAFGEDINLVARCEGEEGPETRNVASGISIQGKEALIEWDITKALKKDELSCEFTVELELGEASDPESFKTRKVEKNGVQVMIYYSTIEAIALDHEGKSLEGATCKLSIKVDRRFDPKGLKLIQSTESDGPGSEKVWKGTTDKEGKVIFEGLPAGEVKLEWESPYLVIKDGWLTEGKFTETGAARKAKLIKQIQSVNYIWWGNPSSEDHLKSATTTPNAMAQLQYKEAPGVQVNMWCQSNATTLHGRLDPSISVHKIGSLSDLMREGGFALHGVFMGRGKLLDSILDTLTRYKFYSAAKDLISLCIMYKQGGYYFDTTTIVPTDDPEGFWKDMEAAPDDIRFPSTAGAGGSYSFYRHDASPFATVFANTTKLDDVKKFWSGNLDVWAMYAPPRCEALAMMVDAYMNRCIELGLDRYPNNKLLDFGKESEVNRGEKWVWKEVWNGLTFHDFVTRACRPSEDKDPGTSARNNIIGNLIITSVQEAMMTYLFEFKNKEVPDEGGVKQELAKFLWKTGYPDAALKAKYSPAKVQAFIPELKNMPKAHSGSWRVT